MTQCPCWLMHSKLHLAHEVTPHSTNASFHLRQIIMRTRSTTLEKVVQGTILSKLPHGDEWGRAGDNWWRASKVEVRKRTERSRPFIGKERWFSMYVRRASV